MVRRKAFEGRRVCLRKAPKDHTLLGLCVMYCGTGYRGLQLQTHAPTHHTVEGVLIQAMKDVGLIDAIERGRVKGDAHHFARSCRTDRGVHAVRNIICLFVPTERLEKLGGCGELKTLLNTTLPITVRVARVTPLMGNFIPRFACNRRVYHYLIPAYALIPPCDTWKSFLEKFSQTSESLQRLFKEGCSFLNFFSVNSEPWLNALSAAVTHGNELLLRYVVGTHRFHNFSVDPSERGGSAWNKKVVSPGSNEAVRSVYRCEIAPRVFLLPKSTMGLTRTEYCAAQHIVKDSDASSSLVEVSAAAAGAEGAGMEQCVVKDDIPNDMSLPFVVFQIEGNSFLFNMIRKIVGTLIATMRGVRETLLAEALSPERRVVCPLAPGPYLYLALSTYRRYDTAVRGSGSARFRPIADEWRGDVAEAAAVFVRSSIAADVVDLDLNRTPPIGTLLAARDAARRVSRPSSAAEDCHLSALKEYRPAAAEKHPNFSEMTGFLRSLRVHNWSIEIVKSQTGSTAGGTTSNDRKSDNNDKVNKRERETLNDEAGDKEEEEEENLQEVVKRSCPDTNVGGKEENFSPLEVTADNNDGDNNNNNNIDDDDDGWIYVAPTEEAARDKRREYYRRRKERSRAWEYNNSSKEKGSHDWNSDGEGSE